MYARYSSTTKELNRQPNKDISMTWNSNDIMKTPGAAKAKVRCSYGRISLLAALLILLLAPMGVAQPGEVPLNTDAPEPLQTYMEQAARNHPGLKADYTKLLAKSQQIPQADALQDPELGFGWFVQPIETRLGPQEARVGITQMFPWFGTLDARAEAAEYQARAALQQFQQTRNMIFYKVQKAWYSMYELERRSELLREQQSILKTFEALALQQYEAGAGSQVDVLRAQNRIDELQVRLENVADEKRVILQRFRELLHNPELDSINVVDSLGYMEPGLLAKESQLLESLNRRNPQLLKLDEQRNSARASRRAAQKEGKPSFGLGFDYIVTGERSGVSGLQDNGKDAMMARAMIKIPLNRDKYRAKEKQAQLQKQSIEHQQDAVQDRLHTELQDELARYREASRTLSLYGEKIIPRTGQAVSIEKSRYSSDGKRFEELLELQRQLLGQKIQYEKALAKSYTSRSYVEYLTGKHNVDAGEIWNEEERIGGNR